jgi:sec-independent protein translocase protein TatC
VQIIGELEVVRKHLLRSLIAVIIAVGISFYFTNDLIAFLAAPVGGLEKLQAIEVTEPIGVFMKVALTAGTALATPYIAFEVWLFMAPGLMPRSRQVGLLAIPFALLLFVTGMAFANYVMLPSALPFLLNFQGFTTIPRAASFFDFTTSMLFWIGVAFEFPLVIFALSTMGLVQPGLLMKQWRIAIVLIAVFAAAITPTVDPVNMGLVMAPMIVLYFLSILLSYLGRPGRAVEG